MTDVTDLGREEEERKATRDIGALMTKNLITQGLSVARQIVVLPLVSPAQLGLYRYVSQLVSYSILFQFGANAVFKIRYPEWQAAGRERDCNVLQTVAWRQVVVGSLLFPPLLAIFLWLQTDLPWPLIAVVAVTGVAPLFADYSVASYTVRGRFQAIAKADIYVAVGSFLAMLGGVLLYGVHGLILGSLVGPILRCLFAGGYFWPRPIVWPGAREFRAHFLFGGRIWIGSSLASIAKTCDVVVLGILIGESSAALGAYALAVTVGQLLSQDVRAATLVHQRSLQVQIGRAGGVANAEIRAATRSYASLDFYLGVIFACFAVVLVAVILPIGLPEHVEATTLVGPLACSLVVLRVKRYSTTILTQAGRILFTALCSGLQMGLLVGGFVALSRWPDATIGHYALVRVGAFWIAALAETVVAHSIMGSTREGVEFAVRTFVSVAPLVAGIGVAPFFVEDPLALIAIALATFAVATGSYWGALDGVPRRAFALLAGVMREKIRKLLRRRRR